MSDGVWATLTVTIGVDHGKLDEDGAETVTVARPIFADDEGFVRQHDLFSAAASVIFNVAEKMWHHHSWGLGYQIVLAEAAWIASDMYEQPEWCKEEADAFVLAARAFIDKANSGPPAKG